MEHMKLVNPYKIDIERKFVFESVTIGCDEFEDIYTNCEYVKTGCYGCQHAKFGRGDTSRYIYYQSIECKLGNSLRRLWVRHDEDFKIVGACEFYAGSRGRYTTSGCSYCYNLYNSGGLKKCFIGFANTKVIFT